MNNLKAILIGLLISIACVTLLPSLKNGFTNWDDLDYVVNNTKIKSFSSDNLKVIFTSFHNSAYQPVTLVSYLVEYHFFGLKPKPYHITNLILHLLNCLLVFWLIFLLSNNLFVSLITAMLFGIHPLQVESVAWISERKGLLYAFFFLGALISYIYYTKHNRSLKYYFLSLFIFLLSILSKAMAVTFPFILLLIDYPLGKDKKQFKDKIPFFVLSFFFSIIAIIANSYSDIVKYNSKLGLFSKVNEVTQSLCFYLQKIFMPVKLSCLYPYQEKAGILSVSLFQLVVIILILGAIIFYRRNRKIVFGSLFFLISILPGLQFIRTGQTLVADRYVYLSLIGIFYMFSESFIWIYNKNQNAKIIKLAIIIFLVTMLGILSFLSHRRTGVWKNSVTLWTDVLKNYSNPIAYCNRGAAYIFENNIEKGIFDFNMAISINPSDASIYMNRANAYATKGNFTQAFVDYAKALEINPNFVEAYSNRAVAYYVKQEYDKSWSDVYKVEESGFNVDAEFLKKLKKASGRQN